MWWPGEWDRMIAKLENWMCRHQGYDKLQSRRLSRGYKSMTKGVVYRFDEAGRPIPAEPRRETSLDQRERILDKFEKEFEKLPRRGPRVTNNFDLMNQDINELFLKCYQVTRS